MKQLNDFARRSVSAIVTGLILTILCGATARAQVAGNASYTLEQTVVAGGGGQSEATNGNTQYSITGTIGQNVAGTNSVNSPYILKSGFWTPPPSSITAASVSVGGRVLTTNGKGLRNTRVVLTDALGNSQTKVTTAFGYYNFSNIAAGQTVVISVQSKRFAFQPLVLTVTEDLTELNFNGVSSLAQ